MSPRITRRHALLAGAAAPLAILPTSSAEAASSAVPCSSPGYFQVPPPGVLIGLLLPAIQKVRDASLTLIDASGRIAAEINIPQPANQRIAAHFDLTFRPGIAGNGGGLGTVHVAERGSTRTWEFPSRDGILIALLLPAVTRTGKPGEPLAASVQVHDLVGNPALLLPFEMQDNRSRIPRTAFFGPFIAQPGSQGAFRLLLPAVQRVRSQALLDLYDSGANRIASISLTPEGSGRTFPVHIDLGHGDDTVQITRVFTDGRREVIGQPPLPENALIGLLVPAVASNGQRVTPLGGSVWIGPEPLASYSFGASNLG